MEPEMRFCTGADGTRIAYATYGEPAARALVNVQAFETAQEASWAKLWGVYEGLSSGHRLITFDLRGVGSSQRDVDDLAMPLQVDDVTAVVDQLRLESFDLIGVGRSGALAAAYAVEHPERVGRLVLWHPVIRVSDSPLQGIQDMVQSIRSNWSLARRSWAALAFPTGPTELQRWYSNMLRDSLTPEVAARHWEVIAEFDGRAILPSVQAPTLVLAISGRTDVEIASVRAVTSLIPDARLVTLKGDWGTLIVDPNQYLAAVRNFLDEADSGSVAAEPLPATGLLTILFTDMAASTTLADRLGDAKAQEVRRAHNEIVRAALAANVGSEIKHTGDGIMASFSTASSALECAIAIQRGVAQHKEEQPDSPLGVYVGLNAGEPIAEDDDLFGTSINLAARICDRAEAGQILAANVVRELAAGKDFLFADLGETELRGSEDPVKLWELRWQER